jgi:hypothetical protein
MAESPAHRFGQIVGEILERAVEPIIAAQAAKHHLYLDKKGSRTCRGGTKLSWKDVNGNLHDLDFVLEKGGTDETQGLPVAFIEVAWRRYTKHSRAKAQEIQGAIMPLKEQYSTSAPFIGAVLAGVFTPGALQQLKSLGFSILFIPTASVVKAFAKFGINAVANEKTPDADFQRQVNLYEALSARRKSSLAAAFLQDHRNDVLAFSDALDKVLGRQIERILILPLHGNAVEFCTVSDALASIENFDQSILSRDFVRFEIEILYDNGNTLRGNFKDKQSAIDFLVVYKPLALPIATKIPRN